MPHAFLVLHESHKFLQITHYVHAQYTWVSLHTSCWSFNFWPYGYTYTHTHTHTHKERQKFFVYIESNWQILMHIVSLSPCIVEILQVHFLPANSFWRYPTVCIKIPVTIFDSNHLSSFLYGTACLFLIGLLVLRLEFLSSVDDVVSGLHMFVIVFTNISTE